MIWISSTWPALQHRLDEPVREPEHEHVLHRLLAEEVVDAEDLVFAPVPVQLLVQRERGLEVGAERLLDHEPAPAVRLVGETGLRDRLGRVGEHAGRQREVEDRGTVEHDVQAAQRLDRDVAAVELDAVDELVEVLLVDVDAVHVDRGAQVLVELVGRPLLARVADDLQVLEPLAVLEREQRGEQQPRGEVARRTEHDERRIGLLTSGLLLESQRSRPPGLMLRRSSLAHVPRGHRTGAGRRCVR